MPRGEIRMPCLAQLVGRALLAVGRKLYGDLYAGTLHAVRHTVLQARLPAADLDKSLFPAVLIQLLVTVEPIPAVAHHFAGLRYVSELPGQFQNSQLRLDDLLLITAHF
jgi:hypothetical protein